MKIKLLLAVMVGVALAAGIVGGVILDHFWLARQPLASGPGANSVTATVPPITAATVEAALTQLVEQPSPSDLRAMMDFDRRSSDILNRLTPDAFPIAAKFALQQAGTKQTSLLAGIMQRWVKADFEAAHKFALQQTGLTRKSAVRAMLDAWSLQGVEVVADWVDRCSDPEVVEIAGPVLMQRLSSSQPARAFGYWKAMSPRDQRMWIGSLFRAWAEKDPAAAVSNLINGVFSESDSRSLLSGALQSWVTRDAAAAVAWLSALPDGGRRRDFIRAVAPVLGRNQPQRGLTLVQSLPAGDDRLYALRQTVTAWAEQDGMAAFTWARALPEGADRQTALEASLYKLAAVNPVALREFVEREPANPALAARAAMIGPQLAGTNAAALMEWAQKLPLGSTRDGLLVAGILSVAGTQPSNAVALANATLAEEIRRSTLRDIFSRWANQDPRSAAVAAVTMPLTGNRSYLYEAVVQPWCSQAPTSAMEWVVSLPIGEDRRHAAYAVVNRIGHEFPAEVTAFVARLGAAEETATLLETAIAYWANLDLEAAAAWLAKQPDDICRRKGYHSLAQIALKTDIKRAAEFALLSPAYHGRYNSIHEQVANEWARTDPKAAVQWLLANASASGLPPEIFNHILSQWSFKSPAVVIEFLCSLPQDSPVFGRTKLVDKLTYPLMEWAQHDPEAAMNWVANKAAPEVQARLASVSAGQWAQHDIKALVAWLENQPANRLRDEFAAGAVGALSLKHPEIAAQQLHLITDDKERQRVAETLGWEWFRHDPVAAEQWLTTTSLPDAVKDRLRTSRRRTILLR